MPIYTLLHYLIDSDCDNPDVKLLLIPDVVDPVDVLLIRGAYELHALGLENYQASVHVTARRIEKRACSDLDEAERNMLLESFDVLCAMGDTAIERVRVVWCPDDEGLLSCHLLVSLLDI